MTKKNFVKVTLVRSLSKCIEGHKACVRGLGLKRIHQTVSVMDSPETRGMINKVSYLLKVEES
jgi:large subunit ribosomal protein L30